MKSAILVVGGIGVVYAGRVLYERGYQLSGAIVLGCGALAVTHGFNDWAFGGL